MRPLIVAVIFVLKALVRLSTPTSIRTAFSGKSRKMSDRKDKTWTEASVPRSGAVPEPVPSLCLGKMTTPSLLWCGLVCECLFDTARY